jgi:hypothetical protein
MHVQVPGTWSSILARNFLKAAFADEDVQGGEFRRGCRR